MKKSNLSLMWMIESHKGRGIEMGKPTGFMEYPRRKTPWRDPVDRALDYYEIYTPAEEEQLKNKARDA